MAEIESLKRSLNLLELTESQRALIEDIKTSEEGGDREKVKTLQKKLNDLVKVKTKLEGGS